MLQLLLTTVLACPVLQLPSSASPDIYVPPSYQPGVDMPLVILLHAYGSSGAAQESYMQFQPLADEYGFL